MASPEAAQIHAVLRQFAEVLAEPSVEVLRMAGDQFGMMTGPVEGVSRELLDVGSLEAIGHTPADGAVDRAVLYLHGGGFVAGSAEAWSGLVDHLAKATGVTVISVNYRLAPEHPFPAALDDAVAAYRWLLDQGNAPQHVAFAGDSAGGGLVLATLAKLREDGVPLPAAAVCFSPYTDATGTADAYKRNSDADFLMSREVADLCWSAYLGGADPRHPHISPLFADFSGFPPLLVQVGDAEVLMDDARGVADRAKAAGVDVTLDVWPEMQHVFVVCAGNIPEADEAMAKAGGFLRTHLGL